MNTQTKIKAILATGLSQSDAAKEIGCSQSAVSALYVGARGKRVTHDLAARVDSAYNRLCVSHTTKQEPV